MLVLIRGPIASGKSTLARRVAKDLAGLDVPSAVIDLDVVHDMLVPAASRTRAEDLWPVARRAVAALAASFEADGVAAVIVDGSYPDQADHEALLSSLPAQTGSFLVSLRVSYGEALRRAQSDPTRGVSRDPAFLSSYYEARRATADTSADLVIDTEAVSEEAAASSIVAALIDRVS